MFAWAQVREARRSREERLRPFVVVDVQPSKDWANFLNLVIENFGATEAHDVSLTFDPPLRSTQDADMPIGESSLVRNGVPMMPPGRRIQVFFDKSHERYDSDLPMHYDVTVNLRDARRRQQEPQHYVIDLSHYYGVTRVEEYGVHHAAKALRGVEQTIAKWSDNTGRLRVWSRDEDRHLLNQETEHFLTGMWPTVARRPPPDLLVVIARSTLIRTLIRAVPPLHRWLRNRLTRREAEERQQRRELTDRLLGRSQQPKQ